MKILITGATGFVGKTLIPYLQSQGMTDLCLLVRSTLKAAELFGNSESINLIDLNDTDW